MRTPPTIVVVLLVLLAGTASRARADEPTADADNADDPGITTPVAAPATDVAPRRPLLPCPFGTHRSGDLCVAGSAPPPTAPAPTAPAPTAPAPTPPSAGFAPPDTAPAGARPPQPKRWAEGPDPKSPRTALALSLGVTLGGWVLVAATGDILPAAGAIGVVAMLVGPTVGHAYAGKTWNTGLKMRLAGIGVIGVAAFAAGGAVASSRSCSIYSDCSSSDRPLIMVAVLAGGGALLSLVGTVYEITTAQKAARRYNASHRVPLKLTGGPLRMRDGFGFGVVGRF